MIKELTPVVAVNDEVLTEHKQFTLKKESDGAVRIKLLEKNLEIYMTPPDAHPAIIYPGVEKPKFWFNGHKIPAGNYTLFSHMKGRYPGITVRFFGGYPVRTLQFIPQVFDDKVERMKRQQKDWEYGMRTGFDMDYFKEYGIGTTTKEEDKIKEKMEG